MGLKELFRPKERIPTPEELATRFEEVVEQSLPVLKGKMREEIPAVRIEPFQGETEQKSWTKIILHNTPISQEEKLLGKDLELFLVSKDSPKVFPLKLRSDSKGLLKGKEITPDLDGVVLKEGNYKIYASSPPNKWLFSVTYK